MKKKIVISLIIILIVVSLVVLLISMNNSPKKKIIGAWTTDGVTTYIFNKDNTGALKVSLSEYSFTYKIDKNNLYIDFEKEKIEDSEYEYSFDDNKLILKGANGTFTFIKK